MQIKITLAFLLTPVRMAIINTGNDNKCWHGIGEHGFMEVRTDVPENIPRNISTIGSSCTICGVLNANWFIVLNIGHHGVVLFDRIRRCGLVVGVGL